jgi:hypothetical protein
MRLFLTALALVPALHFSAALGLLEERGENARQGDDGRDAEEDDAAGAPEGGVAGGAGLLRDVGEGQRAADECEESERGGEDVEVASHGLSLGYVDCGFLRCGLRSGISCHKRRDDAMG